MKLTTTLFSLVLLFTSCEQKKSIIFNSTTDENYPDRIYDSEKNRVYYIPNPNYLEPNMASQYKWVKILDLDSMKVTTITLQCGYSIEKNN